MTIVPFLDISTSVELSIMATICISSFILFWKFLRKCRFGFKYVFLSIFSFILCFVTGSILYCTF